LVPRGLRDEDLLEAAEWRLTGFPALSRDGRYVATPFSPSSGSRAVVDETNPNFDEPNAVEEYPNWFFIVLDATTGAVDRKDVLVGSDEFDAAQRQRTKRTLAAVVRERLAAADCVLVAGGYVSMHVVRLDGGGSGELDGVTVRANAERLSLTDASGRPRLDVPLGSWSGPPLPMGSGSEFTCLYAPHIEEVAIDAARDLAIVFVAQRTNGGDACAGAVNANGTLKVLRLAP
jgi:hypothetical protein